MDRHSGLQHYLRPDGVYITSELQPFANYNPVADAQAVAASFVSPSRLAGPVGVQLLGRARKRGVNLLGKPTVRERWMNFKARLKANLQANQIARGPAALQPRSASGVTTVDTSPRPPNPDVAAIAVTSGWAPSPQTPSS